MNRTQGFNLENIQEEEEESNAKGFLGFFKGALNSVKKTLADKFNQFTTNENERAPNRSGRSQTFHEKIKQAEDNEDDIAKFNQCRS